MDVPFNKQMRAATKEIHSISDALVNAKLAFALSNNDVWAEGLLVFYEVFRFLEEAMRRLEGTCVGLMMVEGMTRTSAFKQDLDHYLGRDWTDSYTVRESVAKYLLHLRHLEETEPDLLIAYIYHLYMGLASGGQILRHKRRLTSKLSLSTEQTLSGNAVTDFGDLSISSLKRQLIDNLNTVTSGFTEAKKQKLLDESKTVFMLNNEMIRSIQGTNQVLIFKFLTCFVLLSLIVVLYLSIK